MPYRLRTIDPATRFVDLLSIDLFAEFLPQIQILIRMTLRVIGAGFGRTGTRSLKAALEIAVAP